MTAAELAAKLHDRGLRPIIDPALDVVLSDCPSCRAQDADPWGLHRPLWVVPRGSTVTFLCTACEDRGEVRHV
jgi:hypothetical protein